MSPHPANRRLLPAAQVCLCITLLGTTFVLDAEGEDKTVVETKAKTAVGHVIPVGCGSHEPVAEAAVCSKDCLRHSSHDSLALQAANGEVFLLHGIDNKDRAAVVKHAGAEVAVTGPFAWQGRLKTLGLESIRQASAEEVEAAKTSDPEYEMTTFYMTFLSPGPKQKTFSEKEVQELMTGHFGHIANQAAAGNLVIAGPFGEQKGERRFSGIYIYKVDSLEEAEALTDQDPTLDAGYFVAETIPWYGPASLGY